MTIVLLEMFIIIAMMLMANRPFNNSNSFSAATISLSRMSTINLAEAAEKLKNLFFYGGAPPPGPGPGGPYGFPGGPPGPSGYSFNGEGAGPGGSGGPPLGYGGGGGYGAAGWGWSPGPMGPMGPMGPYGGPGMGGYGQYSPYYGPNGYGPGGTNVGLRRNPKRKKRSAFEEIIEWSQFFHDINSRGLALFLVIVEIIGLILGTIGLIWLVFAI